MKFSSFYLTATLFAKLPTDVIGSCNTSDQVCQENSGVCNKPLETFIKSGIESSRKDIWNTLSYGHYCGASTKCVASNLEKGGQGVGPEEPEACNVIDEACKIHDKCLDGLKAENNNNPKIGFPLRCQCEFGIVSGMYSAKQARADAEDDPTLPQIGKLCDESYYQNSLIQYLKFNEEDFLAVPFCALISEFCLEETELLMQYQEELAYCGQLAVGLAGAGL
jgi:hypothetical protein